MNNINNFLNLDKYIGEVDNIHCFLMKHLDIFKTKIKNIPSYHNIVELKNKNLIKELKDNHIPIIENCYIEFSKSSNIKFEINNNTLEFNRFMSKTYGLEYGFIPNTLAKDGDPIDIILWTPSYINNINNNYQISAIPLFKIETIDNNEEDHKILCVPIHYLIFFLEIDKNILTNELLNFLNVTYIKNFFNKDVKLTNIVYITEIHEIL